MELYAWYFRHPTVSSAWEPPVSVETPSGSASQTRWHCSVRHVPRGSNEQLVGP